MRSARVEVDLNAVAHNIGQLRKEVSPSLVCAVVKADGYGHGSIAVSEAALAAGADWLAVALIEEAAVLRKAQIDAPILLLSQPRPADMEAAVRFDLRVCLTSPEGVDALAAAAIRQKKNVRVHMKIDTGMNRIGVYPEDALSLAQQIVAHESLQLEGVFTHLAVADEPENPFTNEQIDRFNNALAELSAHGINPVLRHSANSATALAHPRGRLDLVRVGIAVYGIEPAAGLADNVDLIPAMSLRTEVSAVRRAKAGEGVSYGHRHRFSTDTNVATIPIGYADGVPRNLGLRGGSVLIAGKRRPIVGVVTMDQLMVDCGDDNINVGDEVVLIGKQGSEEISADEWAALTDTIAYEIVCGIGPRVPRFYPSRSDR